MLIGYESAFDATQAAAETNQETIRRREFPSERHWFTPGWAQIYDGWVQSPRAGDVIQPEDDASSLWLIDIAETDSPEGPHRDWQLLALRLPRVRIGE